MRIQKILLALAAVCIFYMIGDIYTHFPQELIGDRYWWEGFISILLVGLAMFIPSHEK